MENGEIYVLEYSPSQKCFHLETLQEMIFKNFRDVSSGRFDNVWTPFLMGSQEECCRKQLKLLEEWKKSGKLKEYLSEWLIDYTFAA